MPGYLFSYSPVFFFFFNDTATTEIYTLSLHDALPIYKLTFSGHKIHHLLQAYEWKRGIRSEEHTSELQSQFHLVCRLLLEKKKIRRLQRLSSVSVSFSSTNIPTRGVL